MDAFNAARKAGAENLTLGQLIDKLERADQEKVVVYDFAGFSPANPDSYRGYYEDLAFRYVKDRVLVKSLLHECKGMLGIKITGYKGGEYVVDRDTLLWVSDYGESFGTAITSVDIDSYYVVLGTKYID